MRAKRKHDLTCVTVESNRTGPETHTISGVFSPHLAVAVYATHVTHSPCAPTASAPRLPRAFHPRIPLLLSHLKRAPPGLPFAVLTQGYLLAALDRSIIPSKSDGAAAAARWWSMVVGFRRTISFPAPKAAAAAAASGEAYRVRAARLPCRFPVASASAAVFSGVSSLSIAAATARVEVAATPCWMPSPARFTTPSATPRHHIITTKPLPLRIWWVADLMRWMSRAKRRSASKQHADADASSSTTSSSSAAAQPQPDVTVDPEERERKAAFERLDNLGRCIADVESIGEKVFRALVNTRVSLLNILSPSF
uniref:Uncharacterized protein n=1 Tax=Oryza brachyantha TaxID=4533 RepID=J3LFP9_ORYBR